MRFALVLVGEGVPEGKHERVKENELEIINTAENRSKRRAGQIGVDLGTPEAATC